MSHVTGAKLELGLHLDHDESCTLSVILLTNNCSSGMKSSVVKASHQSLRCRPITCYTTVRSNADVSKLFSDALNDPTDYSLADDAISSVPLLAEGTKSWLGKSNVSTCIIGQLVRLLRKNAKRTNFCSSALKVIIDLCNDRDVTHDPNILRFTEASLLKVVVKVLNHQLTTNTKVKQRDCLLLNLIIKKRQQVRNIDDNVMNLIFQYLFSQRKSDTVVQLCCELFIIFSEADIAKVTKKLAGTVGLGKILSDVMRSRVVLDVKSTALAAITAVTLQTIGMELIRCGVYEPIINVIRDNLFDVGFVGKGLRFIHGMLVLHMREEFESDWKVGDDDLLESGYRKLLSIDTCEVLLGVIKLDDPNKRVAWLLLRQLTLCSSVIPEECAAAELQTLFRTGGIAHALEQAVLPRPYDNIITDLKDFMDLPVEDVTHEQN